MTTLVGADRRTVLGGYISDNYVWPWIFLINVPVGIVLRADLLAQPADRRRRRRASCPSIASGIALLFVWVGALQIMLDKGKDLDWFQFAAHRRAGRSSPWSASWPG